ncbi:hypothetical protein KY310_03675 [Candidatus Woesearchaeota archaeon]|nr:hypothetical protein [Candidatus Woesearchaeota archaeon]
MNTDTLDTIAIEDSVAEIETVDAAKTFIHTVISKFQAQYTIEDPDYVKDAVRPVVRALQCLHRKGFDMKPYADQIIADAAAEYRHYSGEKKNDAYKSTLIVADHIMHRRDTGFFKKGN